MDDLQRGFKAYIELREISTEKRAAWDHERVWGQLRGDDGSTSTIQQTQLRLTVISSLLEQENL
jgi:hypothetical protein